MGGVLKAIVLIGVAATVAFALAVAFIDLPPPTRALEAPATLQGLGG